MAAALLIRFVAAAVLAGIASFSALQAQGKSSALEKAVASSPSCCFFVIF